MSRGNQYEPPPRLDQASQQAAHRLPFPVRAVAGMLGGLALGLLIVARTLEPNPEGLGTHQQLLGLPPCGFRFVFGTPCPSCGMTTSWAHLTRGQVVQSMQSNVGGFLLGVVALVGGSWLVVSAVRNRWMLFNPNVVLGAVLMIAIVAATLIQWLVKLTTG